MITYYQKRHLRIAVKKLLHRDIDNTPFRIKIVHNGFSLPDLNINMIKQVLVTFEPSQIQS